MVTDAELIRHAKYIEEEYPLNLHFDNRLRTGQTLVSATATAADVNGTDLTTALLTGSPTTVTPIVTIILKENGGARGAVYTIRVLAQTQDDVLEQVVELEVK